MPDYTNTVTKEILKADTNFPSLEDPEDIHPKDRGFLGWTFDPMIVGAGSGAPTSGNIIGSRIRVRQGRITNIYVCAVTPFIDPTVGQNFAGLYNDAGQRIAQSADITTIIDVSGFVAGPQELPLSAPFDFGGGWLTVCMLMVATTGGTAPLCRINSSVNLQNATKPPGGLPFRAFTADTGATSLPVSLGAKTGSGSTAYWMAVG